MDALRVIDQSEILYGKIPKDTKSIRHRQAVLMNSANSIVQYKDYSIRKLSQKEKKRDLEES